MGPPVGYYQPPPPQFNLQGQTVAYEQPPLTYEEQIKLLGGEPLDLSSEEANEEAGGFN